MRSTVRTLGRDCPAELGFAVVESWDERDDLVCMERAVLPVSAA